MATPKRGIHDGIISGLITISTKTCGNCNSQCWAVGIDTVTLPTGITPGATLIAYVKGGEKYKPVKYLGITCGCYARFHRQVAHIQGRMK